MFSKVLTASVLSRVSDEDLCAQFNHLWTAYVIAAMGVLITLVQYVGNPIYCWCPAEMPQVQCNYTMALCWVKENYYVSEKESIVAEEKDRYNNTIAYYPWVPWILFFMSAMLNLPHMVWQSFVSSSGLDLSKLVSLAASHDSPDNLAKLLRIWLTKTNTSGKNMATTAKTHLGSLGVFGLGKHHRSYLCGLVLLVKLLYLCVSVGLYASLNIFIDEDFLFYGYEVFENFLKGIPHNSIRFPKQTICDMKIRQMSNVHTYSIQCILPINLYNERIFIVLWFWFIILISINGYSLFKWAGHLLSSAARRSFVKGYVIILFHFLDSNKSVLEDCDDTTVDNCHEDAANHEKCNNNDAGGHEKSRHDSVSCDHDTIIQLAPAPRARRHGSSVKRDTILPRHDRSGHSPRSSIEPTDHEIINQTLKKTINRVTTKMMKHFGHDGVVVFRTLEDAVGIVVANEIFQQLYQQMNHQHHFN